MTLSINILMVAHLCTATITPFPEKSLCGHQGCDPDKSLAISCLFLKATVHDEGVRLTWSAVEQDGSSRYILTRQDEGPWAELGAMESVRNHHQPATFQVVDTLKRKSSYQLKRMRGDSTCEYYNPIFMTGEMIASSKVAFGPNPLLDGDRFQLFAYDCDKLVFTLWDKRRKNLIAQVDLLDEGRSSEFVAIMGHLQKGTYLMEIETEDQLILRQFWRE